MGALESDIGVNVKSEVSYVIWLPVLSSGVI